MKVQCDLETGICVVRGGVRRIRSVIMPSDIVSFAVSTGIGVSVLAGILSGVCYVLAHGIRKTSNRRAEQERYCEVCGTDLKSINGILEGSKIVTCIKCQAKICKFRCSYRDHTNGGWICQTCIRQPNSWYRGILKILNPKTRVYMDSTMNLDSATEEDAETKRKKEQDQVRDFIERLVAAMLGGNVDDASVTKLYNDKHYLPVSGESPCTAHATLKQLIKRLLQECLDLPSLARVAAEKHPAVPPDDTNETYEDLLATAILNKVITNSQNRPSSSANSVSSRLSTSSQIRDDKEYFFGEETLDSKWKTTDLDSTSVSSLEEWIHSDSSRGSTKYVDRLTLEIKQNIEELSGTDSDREEDENLDDKEYFRNASLIQDEKTNWYLQKRKFAGTHSPVPVPMLVPNPTNEVKVLIGDKEIDETSDLSDVGSEYGDTESLPGRNSILIESKTIIGGKNYLSNLLDVSPSDDETSGDSGVKEVKDGDFDDAPSKVTNEKDDSGLAPDDDYVEDTSILSTYSNTEKDTEYTERYASLPRTIMKSPTPKIRSKEKNKQTLPPEIKENEEQKSEIPKNKSVEEETLENGFDENNFPGSYSKKEREKWKHPIEMKNNPYSKENMEKRIKRSNSGVSSLFGSDYYVRQASCPAGTKKSLPKEVSSGNPINELEENYTYSSLPRRLYSPRNSSKNFVRNPLLNFPDNNYSSL